MKVLGDSIKAKVLVGFGLAISMVIIVIYLTYSSFTQLLNSVDELARPNGKLSSLHHSLSTISAAESSIRAYTLTTDEKHFKSYLNHLDTIKNQLDTLRVMMQGNKADLAKIDSIAVLLQKKQNSMQRYVALKREQQKNNLSDKTMQQIASTAQVKPLSTTIKQHTTTTISDRLPKNDEQDKELQRQEQDKKESKKGFFNRLFSKQEKDAQESNSPPQVIIPEVNVTREVQVDTSKITASFTQLAKVRRILNKAKREANEKEDLLQAEELAILKQDKYILDQIINHSSDLV